MDLSSIISIKPTYYINRFEVGTGSHKKTCYNFEEIFKAFKIRNEHDTSCFVFEVEKEAVKKAFYLIGAKPCILVVGKNGTGNYYYN